MYPILFSIGDFSVYSYAVTLAIAFAVGVFCLVREASKAGLPEEKMLEMSIWIMVAAIIGSRLLYVIIEWPSFAADPLAVFAVRSGGLSFHGGLAGGLLAGIWYARRHMLPVGKVADLVAPYLVLGYSIVRIGCLLNGCCFGQPSGVVWALPAAYLDSTLRHPTQLYAFFAGLFIFAVLLWRRKYTRFHGQLFLEFIVYYSVYRFIVEFFRETTPQAASLGQMASLIMVITTLIVIRIWQLRGKKR
ncbi:MAG: prolipoprotein diacylglyceryl transferase [Syntrophomonadaceae bacterium]|nr:prolipoprotein diacylglyceryl transferase [Syntrophomonadaceae bacterium]